MQGAPLASSRFIVAWCSRFAFVCVFVAGIILSLLVRVSLSLCLPVSLSLCLFLSLSLSLSVPLSPSCPSMSALGSGDFIQWCLLTTGGHSKLPAPGWESLWSRIGTQNSRCLAWMAYVIQFVRLIVVSLALEFFIAGDILIKAAYDSLLTSNRW